VASKTATSSATFEAAFRKLPHHRQRLTLSFAEALERVGDESELDETDVYNLLYAAVQAGLQRERRASTVRRDLAKALDLSLADLDPVPYAMVHQAQRLAALRTSLLRGGALTTAAIAEARGITPNTARQWISRNRKADRIFTVTYEGETLVPAFLLDNEIEPRPEAREPIRALRAAGEDGWALWTWFATPSAWIGGRVPAELLDKDPDLVAESARQRAASAA
jgi:hypothetical protein